MPRSRTRSIRALFERERAGEVRAASSLDMVGTSQLHVLTVGRVSAFVSNGYLRIACILVGVDLRRLGFECALAGQEKEHVGSVDHKTNTTGLSRQVLLFQLAP
jgi:hypothetical protein